jgi:hypothetical protein
MPVGRNITKQEQRRDSEVCKDRTHIITSEVCSKHVSRSQASLFSYLFYDHKVY